MYPKEEFSPVPCLFLSILDPSEKATFSLLNTDHVKEGDNVTMKCETDGNPQPEFDFTKDVCVHFMYTQYKRKRNMQIKSNFVSQLFIKIR